MSRIFYCLCSRNELTLVVLQLNVSLVRVENCRTLEPPPLFSKQAISQHDLSPLNGRSMMQILVCFVSDMSPGSRTVLYIYQAVSIYLLNE